MGHQQEVEPANPTTKVNQETIQWREVELSTEAVAEDIHPDTISNISSLTGITISEKQCEEEGIALIHYPILPIFKALLWSDYFKLQ
jgi:hypothetical protein